MQMSSVSCGDTGVGWSWGWRDRAENASFVFVMTVQSWSGDPPVSWPRRRAGQGVCTCQDPKSLPHSVAVQRLGLSPAVARDT
jgi:hypothetical protein